MTQAEVEACLEKMALSLEQDEEPAVDYYQFFSQNLSHALIILHCISKLPEAQLEERRAYFSACIFALDVCVAQIQSAIENGNKSSEKLMSELMQKLAELIEQQQKSLLFWLPILNAFYNVHAELSPQLRDAYLALVDAEETLSETNDVVHLHSIRELIHEFSDLNVFEMADHFFGQSYAMPADFFIDLLLDLYSIEEGQEIGLLILLYPKREVRETILDIFGTLLQEITISSVALSRLKAIQAWYPVDYHPRFAQWIREQRKKGVIFHAFELAEIVSIKATEVDGSGSQGLFIHLKRGRAHRLCGMLLKYDFGIKDVWVTPALSRVDIVRYQREAFKDAIILREIDEDYAQQMINHFLAITIEVGDIPDLHLLEIQEEIGWSFVPKKINVVDLIEQWSVEISPFTPTSVQASLLKSKQWLKSKRFAESWYIEHPLIDKIVNQYCTYERGLKTCRIVDACNHVLEEAFEMLRERWIFFFVWVTVWLKSVDRRHQQWQESFMIAYLLSQGEAMLQIPLMQDIAKQSVLHSLETMQLRKTHLL